MDDLRPGVPSKRKADQLADEPAVWMPNSPPNDPAPYKRPRLQQPPAKSPALRAATSVILSRPPPVSRLPNDLEDTGIDIANSPPRDPGPSSGSLRRVPKPPVHAFHPSVPVDLSSPAIPSLQPLINRHTLRELHLDAILRNPQLRHDILFDSGLQFRPSVGRRKRESSDKYWNAITRELETGCTCVSFDSRGNPHELVCVCSHTPLPAQGAHPAVVYSAGRTFTLRIPSRIPALLNEFLQVLLLVIQPLSSLSGIQLNPDAETFKAQVSEHTAQAMYIRSIFDPALIEQELRHNVFDMTALFRLIGGVLKGHCAPMRDAAVEEMLRLTENANGATSKTEAVKAVRMCMDILECMKLDIANHQLQSLRPFLIRTSGQFELKAFITKSVSSPSASLRLTREWLARSHSALLSHFDSQPMPYPLSTKGAVHYTALDRNKQVYLSLVRGIVDLVFQPPCASSSSARPSSPPTAASTSSLDFPETLYLDHTRLGTLNGELTDLMALWSLLLLTRQLTSKSGKAPSAEWFTRVKGEIKDVAGTRIGMSFTCRCIDPEPRCLCHSHHSERYSGKRVCEMKKAGCVKKGVILQVASKVSAVTSQHGSAQPESSASRIANSIPDSVTLDLAMSWADMNISHESKLNGILKERLKESVFRAVVALVYPGNIATNQSSALASISSASTHPPPPSPFVPQSSPSFTAPPPPLDAFERSFTSPPWPAQLLQQVFQIGCPSGSGMEIILDEIRGLSERIAKLVLVHLNAYLAVYEQEGFVDLSSEPSSRR